MHACGPVCWTLTPQPSKPCIRSCAKRQGPARQGPQADIAGERCAPSFLGNIQHLGLSSGSTSVGARLSNRVPRCNLGFKFRFESARVTFQPRKVGRCSRERGSCRSRAAPHGGAAAPRVPPAPSAGPGPCAVPRIQRVRCPRVSQSNRHRISCPFVRIKYGEGFGMRCTVAASCYSLIHFYLGFGKKVDLRSIEVPNKMNQKQHICRSLSVSCSFCKETISWISCPRWFWHFLYFCTT